MGIALQNTSSQHRLWCWFWSAYYTSPKRFIALCACALSAAVMFVIPTPAFADFLSSALGLDKIGPGLAESAAESLNNISTFGVTDSFAQLISGGYETIRRGCQAVTEVCGYSVLAIVFLIQMAKLASRMDGNAALPGVKDVMMLLIFFVVFKHVVDNSFRYCEALYNSMTYLIRSLNLSGEGFGTVVSVEQMQAALPQDDWFGAMIMGLVMWFSALIMQIVGYLSVLGRSIQAYVLAVFSPIPLSLLGAEETRQWGIGYIKNFLGVCLTGGIILIILALFPALLSLATSGGNVSFPILIAVLFVGITSLMKSGSWARDLLGG